MAPVLTGYYRFSDIWFEWHQTLPDEEDISTLKSVLQYDALVHPDHPLMADSTKGVELFMGTLHNGESRLMFSSAQVEYIRYWLHAMQLTKDLIPIPNSEALLTSEHLRNVSPMYYNDASVLKKALKTIEKNNKRLRFVDGVLMKRRHLFERVRTFWAEETGIWCALDFESWEYDHTVLTEFGWSLIRWENGKEIDEQGHLIVKENRTYSNGTYVPDYRDNFLFGTSETISKKAFKQRITDLLSEWTKTGPLFLVFHDARSDINYLKSKSVEAPLGFVNYALPDVSPDEGIYVVDTADLFAALEGDSARKRSLEQMCRHLQIPTDYLHNAGNDSHYTLLALKSMASGDPVDIQREKRWPGHTEGSANGVKVQFMPWEEKDDYSDSEGLMPPAKVTTLPGDPTAVLDPAFEAQMLREEQELSQP
ncbi:hypothetical protein GLOTRDRAFT_35133 [Gloeophyllum trabeum ATCC 11539]|uniref:Gfd2/YDR514C-like C-terminal domain-containing protein n=1 Tax=Gloeophyllum trabeum (strain ATCC 11539 / FP-39264 / Madison 617) TaxID=670483 RepID=S7QI44_GLOTA|nr:uncharacterized protein GLOTRDRAFT_35133 [Gloeophyllum trabeum ATCC 11539]EPQ59436.1 hypothetical protein GLOTRDRAFT_35133 [Gloeophyllum trabeum ATCC 11539]